MFDFNPKVEFFICHQTVISGVIFWEKKKYEKFILSPTSATWHAVFAHWQLKTSGKKKSLSSP